jgi:hypothetical protein
MPLDIEFGYNSQIFDPPAPVVPIELRSPASPTEPNPARLIAQIDSGADGSAIPQILVDSLHLCKVDEVKVGGYDAGEEGDFEIKPVYSVLLTVLPLKPVLAQVIPLSPETYAIIGRDIINEWLLTLDGPKLKAYLKSTTKTT